MLSLVNVTPVISGNGQTKSTNYHPSFRIDGWVKRPDDLIHIPAPARFRGYQRQWGRSRHRGTNSAAAE